MDVCFKEVSLQTKSFKIIQNAFCKHPTKMEKTA